MEIDSCAKFDVKVVICSTRVCGNDRVYDTDSACLFLICPWEFLSHIFVSIFAFEICTELLFWENGNLLEKCAQEQ